MLSTRQLAFLVAAALVPVVVFAAVVLALFTAQQREQVEDRLRATATTAAAIADRQILREFAALSALAGSETLDHGDMAAFDRQARRAVASSGYWFSVLLTDAERQLVNTLAPWGATLPPLLFPDQIAEVMRTGQPRIFGVLDTRGRIGEPVVAIRIPVTRGGTVRYVLSATLPAWSFRSTLGEHPIGEGGRMALLDAEKRLVARTAAESPQDQLVGQPPSDVVRAGLTGTGGFFRAPVPDGTDLFMAYAVAPLSGWTVVVGTPAEALATTLRRARMAVYGGGGLALLLAAGLAFTLIRTMMRRQLAERTLADLQAEKAAERRISDIAANFPGIIYRRILHPDGTLSFTYVSDGVEPMVGRGRSEFLRQPLEPGALARMMTPETAQRWLAELDRTARTLDPMRLEGDLVDAAGRVHRFRTHSTTWRDRNGDVVWDGVVLDVTDLHEAEAAQRRQAERLAFALEAAGAGLWDWDVPTNRLTWSDSLWHLLGYDGPDGEPTMETLERRVHPEDWKIMWDAVALALATGAPLNAEFRVLRPDGEVRWVAAIARSFLDGEGRVVRMTGLDIDITDRKRIQEELRQAKDDAERASVTKSKFLAAASHDLRQPVQSLLFFIHVLGERLSGHDAQPLVSTMGQALDALKQLLDGILDLSKLDAGVIVPEVSDVSIAEVLRRLESEYAPRFADKGLRLRVVPRAATVESDATLLGRILGNLVENALKYTERGGVVVGCRRRGAFLRIEVWDSGLGIPAERQDDIFDEFVQVGNPERDRARGLGLGLAIVRRLANLLGHRLHLRSSPGRGSVFMVEVPLASTSSASSPGPAAAPAVAPSRAAPEALAVVIDDEAIILEGMKALLESWGYAVVAASDADAAVAALGSPPRPPDVVVADFRLRDGRTGVEAIAAIRAASGAEVPAVLLTGDTGPNLVAEAERVGFRILHKPVPPAELRDLLRTLAAGGGTVAETMAVK